MKLLSMKKMNMKSEISMKSILRYIRDFSIVVAGVAVTLYVTDKATYRSEKRDIKLYLTAIKLEAEENIYAINEAIDALQIPILYTNYLWTHDKNSLNTDTLRLYIPMASNTSECWLMTNAFEMFKNSGSMRLMDNRELLMDIWNIYAGIDWLKDQINLYNERHWKEFDKETTLQLEHNIFRARFYNFYITGAAFKMREKYELRLESLNYLVSELEKELSSDHQ
jgi:hypothetical protein